MILQGLEEVPSPDPQSEQYPIPANLAAEILNIARIRGDIVGRKVADLGCGSGKLALGAAIMGAEEVLGVDKDREAIEITNRNIDRLKGLLRGKIELLCCDISQWQGKFDTVVQNPPFGAQKKRADRAFLLKAMECAPRIYSLHRRDPRVRNFITQLVDSMGFGVHAIVPYGLSIPHMFQFHRKRSVSIPVDLYIIARD